MKRRWSAASALAPAMFCGASLILANSASAHIHLVAPLVKNNNNGDEKEIPCDGPRGSTVFTFEPGAFITITVDEYVPHDSYFRIAFDDDGQDFVNPISIDPINPNRVAEGRVGSPRADNPRCMDNAADKCGESDFCSQPNKGAIILYDNIDPHLGSASAGMYSWTVQLPNVECENCTLQVIQVMQDIASGFHGPFDGDNDMYHRCLDITLKKGAGVSGPGNAQGPAKVGVKEPAMVCAAPTDPGSAGAGGSGAAGASGAAGGASEQAGGSAAGSSAAGSAATGGAAGAAIPATGAAGVSAPVAGTSAAAGSSAPRAGVGSVASPAGAAGKVSTPSAGSAGTSAAPVNPSTPPASGSSDSGGCSVSSTGAAEGGRAAWFVAGIGALAVAMRSKRRRTRG